VGANFDAEVIACVFGLLLLTERVRTIWGSASEFLTHTMLGITGSSVYRFVVARIKIFIPFRDKNVFDYLTL